MAELTLEPYATVQSWHLPAADGHWEEILLEYSQTLAQRCAAAGNCVIGHIKALALFSEGSYFRVSAVAANIPASMEGKVPPGCTDLDLTLNVLVYGLERTLIEQITRETAAEFTNQWKGAVNHKNLNQPGVHQHHPNHQHHSKGEK